MDPHKIAKIITDDPDIFNEMASSSGGVAGGVGASFFGSARQARRKGMPASEGDAEIIKLKKKKPTINRVSGEVEDGELLLGDTKTDNPEKPLEEGKKEALKKLRSLSQQRIYTLNPEMEKGSRIPDQSRRRSDRSLEKAEEHVEKIYRSLKHLMGIGTIKDSVLLNYFKQYQSVAKKQSTSSAELSQEYRRFNKDLPRSMLDLPKTIEGNEIPPPCKGWLGIDNWAAVKLKRRYYSDFFREVCVVYMQSIDEYMRNHVGNCEWDSKCNKKDHRVAYIIAHCQEGDHDFPHAWDKHHNARIEAIRLFKEKGSKKSEKQEIYTKPSGGPNLSKRAAELKKLGLFGTGALPLDQAFPEAFKNIDNLPTAHDLDVARKKVRGSAAKKRGSPFSNGFDPPKDYEKGDIVIHNRFGKGRVHRYSSEEQESVHVEFGGGIFGEDDIVKEVFKSDLDLE